MRCSQFVVLLVSLVCVIPNLCHEDRNKSLKLDFWIRLQPIDDTYKSGGTRDLTMATQHGQFSRRVARQAKDECESTVEGLKNYYDIYNDLGDDSFNVSSCRICRVIEQLAPSKKTRRRYITRHYIHKIFGKLEDIVDSYDSIKDRKCSVPCHLRQAIVQLGKLVAKEKELSVACIEDTFNQEKSKVDVQMLELLASTVELDVNRQAKIVSPNITLLATDKPVRGFRVASTAESQFRKDSFDFLKVTPDSKVLRNDESNVVVDLPSSVWKAEKRASFMVYRNNEKFHSSSYIVNSLVISVTIDNVNHFHGGEVIDIYFRPIVTALARNESRTCAYWHFQENSTGYWSQEGCTFIPALEDGMMDTCRCNHLTHFAQVLVENVVFSEVDEAVLELLTIVGCSLSTLGLTMIGITALLFRSWRQDFNNKIWLQLSVAILMLVVSFLLVIFVHYDHYHIQCMLLGVTLHYSVLASCCWMLVAAVVAYRRLVLVFTEDPSHKLLRAAGFAWGAPGVVIVILLSVSPHSYGGQFQEVTSNGAFCYPSGLSLWLTVYAPVSMILVTNWTLLALIVRCIFFMKKIQKYGALDASQHLSTALVSCMLVFLFGLPWIFGLFASNVVAAYLFTLCAAFQGFILFLLFVVGKKKTRELWLSKMCMTRRVQAHSNSGTRIFQFRNKQP